VMYSPVRNVVGICSALFVLAIGYLALAEGREAAGLLDAFRLQPPLSKATWAVVVLVPIVLVPVALWLGEVLVRQRQAAQALELRLGGVREGVKALEKPQADAEAAVHHRVRTDPEDAIVTMQQRLTEAERFAQIQQGRSEAGDLATRVEQLRAQQQALQERLAPVLEKRQSIEQLFMELGTRQSDIERALADVASADDAVVIDAGLKNMRLRQAEPPALRRYRAGIEARRRPEGGLCRTASPTGSVGDGRRWRRRARRGVERDARPAQ